MSATILDAKGLNCPLPVLKLKRAIRDVAAGGVLRVLATDPGAVKDFEAFCRATGNQLVAWKEEAGVFTFEIKKAA
jgi:tRNA 2-thiouridine synthesizing protein A